MCPTVSVSDAREKLSNVLNEVAYGHERYIVERRGQPLAAIIPASEYNDLLTLLGENGVLGEVQGIPVTIRFTGEEYFVSDDLFNLYGEGNSLEAARQDYCVAVQEYRDDLEAHVDNLAPYLAEHLAQLRALESTAAEASTAEAALADI
jgi:prevent-host-death family protein